MLFKFQILLWIVSSSLIGGAFNIYDYADAEPQKINPEIVDYHLELAQGILETCYTRDPNTDSLIPNPTLPMLSDLASFCKEKMQSLDDFLTEFVDDEDGKMYAEHVETKSESIKSEPMASKLEP
ncbi:MAG TPA: hypothetical protein VE445_12790 [Nitrososphaeraceae archaeon]|nr:hypothetical protein [Nitrososphaeraceae archaeon]